MSWRVFFSFVSIFLLSSISRAVTASYNSDYVTLTATGYDSGQGYWVVTYNYSWNVPDLSCAASWSQSPKVGDYTVSQDTSPHSFSSGSGTAVHQYSQTGSGGTLTISIDVRINQLAGNGGGVISEQSTTLTLTVGLSTQTCTLSNTGGSALKGDSIVGIASGAQGGNTYSITCTNGSASINPTTGAYTVIPDAVGTSTFTVSISAGGGYSAASASGTITVQSSAFVTVTIPANKGDFPITYTMTQDGQVVGTHTAYPGDSATITQVAVPNKDPVTLSAAMQGVTMENGSKVLDGGGTTAVGDPLTLYPTLDSSTTSGGTVVPNPTPTAVKNPTTTANQSSDVWVNGSSTTGNTTTGNTTTGNTTSDALTNATYREGVDKINDRLDDIGNSTSSLFDLFNAGTNYDQGSSMSSAQAAAAGASKYSGPSLTGSPSAAAVPADTATTALGTWSIGGNPIVISMVPDGIWGGASSVLVACRPLLTWAAVVWLVWSCSGVLSRYIVGLTNTQAVGALSSVEDVLPGIAQAKSLGAAGAVVVVIVGCVAALVVVLDTFLEAHGFSISSFFSSVGLSSAGAGLGLLNRYVPIQDIVAIVLFRAGFAYIVGPTYLAAASVVKFLKL